jgi:hypothetical protein
VLRSVTGAVVLTVVLSACAGLPDPECPPPPEVPFGCDYAVSTAAARLPSSHPIIVRIQVVKGDYRPLFPSLGSAAIEHVIFTYKDRSRVAVALYMDMWTGELIADEAGRY